MLKGELAALAVALLWTGTALLFENAAKRLGSLSLNLLRLTIAFVLLSIYSVVTTGHLIPSASSERIFWLAASGVIGFFIGDFFLFKAFILIGSRVTMLIMSSAPLIAAVLGYSFLGENPTSFDLAAIGIALSGIAIVVLSRDTDGRITFSHPVRGVIAAFLGAAGQAGGLVLSKLGVAGYDPFLATDIRVIAGLISFILFAAATGRLSASVKKYSDRKGVLISSIGAFSGPFLGVSLSLYAVKNIDVGIASTIMQMVPIFLAIYAFIFLKEKIRPVEVIGIALSLGGVALLFLF